MGNRVWYPNPRRTAVHALRDLFVREKVNDGTLLVQYVPTKDNIADILTKATNRQVFMRLREKLCFKERL